MEEGGILIEWRIENLSHWCSEVHGDCIRSPEVTFLYFSNIELYPKGIGGLRQHLVVKFSRIYASFCGDVSLYCSDGTELCKKPVTVNRNEGVVELPPGPKFEEVLSRIREGDEDFVTLRLQIEDSRNVEQRMKTTINASVISVKINAGFLAVLEANTRKYLCWFYSNGSNFDLEACLKYNKVQFRMYALFIKEYPFGVSMSVGLTRSDGTFDSRATREHVFHDNTDWPFPDSLDKNEVAGKGISLILCFKTSSFTQSISYSTFDCRNVSIELNNKISSSGREPSSDPGTSNRVSVFTKDPRSQISPTLNTPDVPAVSSNPASDSVAVLSQELMCLYQDQDFSDITLKCNNVSFPVHKNILSARSPVFKSMLSTDMTEAASSEVVVQDLDPSTLSLFLAYLYTGAVEEDLECDRALKLYYAADKYQVPALKGECVKFLCAQVSISTVCDVLSLGDRHSDDQLTSVAHDFILNHYSEVLKSSEWQSFMCREPLLAVKTVTQFAAKGSFIKIHDI